MSAALGGCVIPPPLQTDEPDAGANRPPVFRSVKDESGDELVRPGPLSLTVGVGELRITSADLDLADTLYYRMYIDYGITPDGRPTLPTASRAECAVGPGTTPTVERTVTCPLLGVCTDDLDDTLVHLLELDLLDRVPTSTESRLYRDVTPPGEIATWAWRVVCHRAAKRATP